MADKKVLPRTPSIKKESIAEFLLYKTLKAGTKIRHGGHTLRDIYGNTIKADGAWDKGKDAMNQFLSAISQLHRSKDNGGAYQDLCRDCISLPLADRHKGCIAHSDGP